jgi:hypothetical protein
MKKYLLALALFALSCAGVDTAWATCTGPAVMKDNAATTFNMTLQQDGTGNCNSAVALGAGGSTTMQSAAVANGNGTILTVGGFNVALVNINCSVACSGGTTINFEGTDSTSTFFPVQAFPVGGGTPVSSAITSGQYYVSLTGLASIRARISAYSAGTITVTGTPSYGANAQQMAAAGGATSANQGTTADVPCTVPTSATACSEIAIAKAIANVANSATPAGENHIGEIASNQIKVQVAQTVTAASAYAAGNAIGGLQTIAGAARVSGSLGAAGTGGILTGLMMNSKSLQTTQVDVFLFDANPSGSTCTDKTAFSLATADFDKVIGVVTIPGTAANGAGWYAGTVGSTGVATYYPVTYDLASATSIFACAVTRGTPTYTATTDVSFKYNILRN